MRDTNFHKHNSCFSFLPNLHSIYISCNLIMLINFTRKITLATKTNLKDKFLI